MWILIHVGFQTQCLNIYIHMKYIHTHTNVSKFKHMHICNHENNVQSRLRQQQLRGESCTWAHDVRLYNADTNKTKSDQQTKQGA